MAGDHVRYHVSGLPLVAGRLGIPVVRIGSPDSRVKAVGDCSLPVLHVGHDRQLRLRRAIWVGHCWTTIEAAKSAKKITLIRTGGASSGRPVLRGRLERQLLAGLKTPTSSKVPLG